MPRYIVDTNVLSNRRDADGDPNVAEWFQRYSRRIRISVVTVAEMHRGLLLLEQKAAEATDHRVKARLIAALRPKRAWYDVVLDRFADRIESIDRVVAEKWAEVSVRFPSLRDGGKAIAATAMAKDYGIATRNPGDFRHAGVALVNPFDPDTWGDDPDDDPVLALLRT
jgi:predicted nucleic acid-binding protein